MKARLSYIINLIVLWYISFFEITYIWKIWIICAYLSLHRKMYRKINILLSIERWIEVINPSFNQKINRSDFPFLYLNVVLKDKVLYFLYTLKVVQGLETTLMSLHALFDTWEKYQYLYWFRICTLNKMLNQLFDSYSSKIFTKEESI